MTERCPWIAPLDYSPRGTCDACDPRWCHDALDEAIWLARHDTKGLALWLRYPDPSAVLALADRYTWRREWLDEFGAPTPLTAEWVDGLAEMV